MPINPPKIKQTWRIKMVSGTAQIPYKMAKAKHCSQIIQDGTAIGFVGDFSALKGVALIEKDFRIF
jgi:hypothetical protein